MATQTTNGKAFEYALLNETFEKLKLVTNVSIKETEPYWTAKRCFESFDRYEQDQYKITASSAINFLIDIEPRLKFGINKKDVLELELLSDAAGQLGDVRDLVIIRALQKWEIGISAKNNHKAVKHPRLSNTIDFGDKWLSLPCSSIYFDDIDPVFRMLSDISKSGKELGKDIKWKDIDNSTPWSSLDEMHQMVYIPILKAFKAELMRLSNKNPEVVAENLVKYLIGNKDFYKVIRGNKKVEVQAFNIHGTLNLPFKKEKPKATIPKLKLPSRLIEIVNKPNSSNILIAVLDEGWQISFRIHNAKSSVEASLKFDVNLVSAPESLFRTHKFTYE